MVMLTFTVDKNNKLIDVKKSKEKGLFGSKKDQEYANKILKKLKKKKNFMRRKNIMNKNLMI